MPYARGVYIGCLGRHSLPAIIAFPEAPHRAFGKTKDSCLGFVALASFLFAPPKPVQSYPAAPQRRSLTAYPIEKRLKLPDQVVEYPSYACLLVADRNRTRNSKKSDPFMD